MKRWSLERELATSLSLTALIDLHDPVGMLALVRDLFINLLASKLLNPLFINTYLQ